MSGTKKHALATAAALLIVGAGGYWASAVAQPGQPVNAPGALAATRPSAGFADLVAKVAPAVVSIDVLEKAGPSPVALMPPGSPFGFELPGQGGQTGPFGFQWMFPQTPQGESGPMEASGSGFFVSPDGYIVTNNHVVAGARKITVRTNDGRSFPATVIGTDPATDLAVVKVAGGPFAYVNFEDRAKPRVGDWVVAVGNPFGLGGSATAGIVSALGRKNVSGSSYVDYMQIDAPINHGNSGGPTFDVEGRVVGVNSAIYSPSGGSVGIGFDIPADVAASVSRQLIQNGKVTRGYIGASIQTLSPELAGSLGLRATHGALVADLTPGAPAERAGLRPGDVIVGIDGHDVGSASDLTRQVAMAHPGQDIQVAVLRDGQRRQFTVQSGLRPAEASLANNGGMGSGSGDGGAEAPAVMGMQVAPDPGGGLVVEGVAPGSDAADKGLQQGDVILRVGQRRLLSSADLSVAAAAARAAGRKDLPLLVARGGQKVYVPVQVAGASG